MSDTHLIENKKLLSLQQRLKELAQQLREGLDVAPAQRLRLEGIAAALIADGVDIGTLQQMCATVDTVMISIVREDDTLRFNCWQQRAPVYPTTSD